MGGRAVEGTGLENRRTRKGIVGSNPTPSAFALVTDGISSLYATVCNGMIATKAGLV
jgi:hypothetical protein